MENHSSDKSSQFLAGLRVFGFDAVEPLILAALVSEDPILLIGNAGTGKTFLLNSISEALRLEHRHYNASLISFDDLIGFPYPEANGKSVKFLPTPATVWEANSVLIDELSRCKPETQNKFFSLIHERKMQGIPLDNLKYRWAAMNPFSTQNSDNPEIYEGSNPLDPALADRFGFIIEVPDWGELTEKEQVAVIDPSGEGLLSDDKGALADFVKTRKEIFRQAITNPRPEVVSYVRMTATLLTDAGLRISPRRARIIARNITALLCVGIGTVGNKGENYLSRLFRLALTWSLPHRAYLDSVPDHKIESAHREALRITLSDDPSQKWVLEFNSAISLKKKSKCFLTQVQTVT